MPYTESNVPPTVTKDKAAQWAAVWNSAYTKAKKDGKSDKDAESSAFAQAWGVIGKESKSAALPEPRWVANPDGTTSKVGDVSWKHGELVIKESKAMSNTRVEHRVFKTELRSVPSAMSPKTTGYAAVFNTQTDIGNFREQIAPTAFNRAIAEKQDVRALFNHDPNQVLGRTKSGSLTLSTDSMGLKFNCDMPDTQTGRDVHTLVQRGDLDQCSFGFVVKDETVTYGADGTCLRTVNDVDLMDISIVTYPAYESTSVEARSRNEVAAALRSAADECQCECPECEADNCDDCSITGCTKPNCRCMRADVIDPHADDKNAPDTAVTPSRSKEWALTRLAEIE